MDYKKILLDSLMAEPKRTTFNIAEMTSRPVTPEILKATKPNGFPLPYGSTYSDVKSLTEDIIKRCTNEGYSILESANLLKLVLAQYGSKRL